MEEILTALLAPGTAMEPGESALLARAGAPYGLALSAEGLGRLNARRAEALRATGRVEFGPGVLGVLAYAFCDSPYIVPQDWEETLGGLQELFYAFKGECRERLDDDELLGAMRRLFDGPAGGSVAALANADRETLLHAARREAETEEETDEEEF